MIETDQIILSAIETFNTIKSKMDAGKKFSYVRFGDQEIRLMGGMKGKPTNHNDSPELASAIIEAYQEMDENFLIASACKIRDGEFGYSKRTVDILQPIINQYMGKTLHYSPLMPFYMALQETSQFKEFIRNYIRPNKVLFVGGSRLNRQSLIDFLKIDLFIETPDQNAFYYMDDFYPHVINHAPDYDIIIPCLGNCKAPFQHKLWKDGFTSLDIIGSLANGIVEDYQARKYIKNYTQKFMELKNDD